MWLTSSSSTAFDVARGKVGRDLAEAITAAPNNTIRFADVPSLGVEVRRRPTMDGIGPYRSTITEAPEREDDVARTLRETGTDVLVLPHPWARRATCWYAEQALKAGCTPS